MIKYHIDKNDLIVTDAPQDAILLTIQGWAFSDIVEDLDFEVGTDAPYRVKLYPREDIDTKFAMEKKSGLSGFTIELVLYDKIKEVPFSIIEGGEYEETVTVKVDCKKMFSKNLKLRLLEIKKKHKSELERTNKHIKKNGSILMGNVEGKMHYNFDEIVYVNAFDEVILRGWQVAFAGENKIKFEDADIKIEDQLARPDVAELFGLEKDKEKNGFEYRVALQNPEKLIVNIVNYDIGKVKVCIPVDSINGSVFDARSVLSGSTEKEYRRKYGDEGISFKKKEREIFFQEAIMNSRPYKPEPVHYESTTKNADISILVAVNSDKHAKRLTKWAEQLPYENVQLVLAGEKQLLSKLSSNRGIITKVECELKDKEALLMEAYTQARQEYVLFLDQEDMVDDYFFAYVVDHFGGYDYIYSDYDLLYKNEPIVRVNRISDFIEKENEGLVLTACVFRKKCAGEAKSIHQIIENLKVKKGFHNKEIMFHYNVVENSWDEEPTKAIAFYLTQYHITEENNKWWGEGFTEWKNVKRAYPMFEGHDQPRIPTDMGYYDLVEDKTAQYRQIDLAKKFGIYGFCYYYYWFEGKRLLRKPLDQFLENRELDLPYCICWANETWSKRWDGQEHEILMQQVHNEKTDRDFIYDIIPMFRDERYIKIDGKPLLLIYRFELFPAPNQTIQLWREICRKENIGEIHIAIVQAFDAVDHRIYGADSSVEFPPHKINAIPNIGINDTLTGKNKDFEGHVYSYRKIVENVATVEKRDYTLFPGSMLKWDNTARRLTTPDVFHDFSPELYRRWLIKNHHYTRLYNKDKIMFINAWNEWAEGSYLEPDETYGTRLLEVTNEVIRLK